MVRAPFYDENGVKKGAWSVEEDEKLKACIQKHGLCNWRELPRLAGLSRCGKSCRLRWINYLRPDVKRGNYSKQEEELILQLHQQHGNKWSLIAAKLSGRTDNEIKNYWHTHLKKRKEMSATKKQQKETNSKKKNIHRKIEELNFTNENPSHKIYESSSSSSEMSTICSNQESREDHSRTLAFKFEDSNIYNNNNEDFWADPLVAADILDIECENSMNFDVIEGFNPPYDLEFDEDLLYQVMKEMPHNYQFPLYPY